MNQNNLAKEIIRTAEFVSPKHPDKLCDLIADTLLDEYLKGDPKSRCAIEVMGGHGHVTISGEVTSATEVDIEKTVQRIVGLERFQVHAYLTKQSLEIARGVDTGGAGDQGVMTGYATRETANFMPLEYELARDLCRKIYEKYPYDGKTQVTVAWPAGGGDKAGGAGGGAGTSAGASARQPQIRSVVASFQNAKTPELRKLVEGLIEAHEYFINPAGEWTQGGFDADSGLSGRKIVVDNYGPRVPVGGGSFSGKDYTKVDRSGAYMARRIAVDELLKHGSALEVSVRLAYAIGKREPVMAVVHVDGVEREIEGYDLTPGAIYKFLELDRVRWAETAVWGHMGRDFNWR